MRKRILVTVLMCCTKKVKVMRKNVRLVLSVLTALTCTLHCTIPEYTQQQAQGKYVEAMQEGKYHGEKSVVAKENHGTLAMYIVQIPNPIYKIFSDI